VKEGARVCIHPSRQSKNWRGEVACRIKEGDPQDLLGPGDFKIGIAGLRDVLERVLLLSHQCECHGIRTLDADEASEDRTVGIPHRLDLS
jgi:hypothetical protein